MLELHQRIAAHIGRSPHFAALPDALGGLIASIPGTPISADQWKMLQHDNVVAPHAEGLAALGITPTPLDSVAPGWLRRLIGPDPPPADYEGTCMTDLLTAIILGIVEGVTEFLPVSSTGHLVLATELLGYDPQKWAVFNIAIQPGAILAIVALYWRTFWAVAMGLVRREPASIAFVRNLLIAFVPAVVLGLVFNDQIDALLENATVVAWALIAGGIGILVVERLARTHNVLGIAGVSVGQS
ncbi:hypothetical protein LTR94_029102, partial [Friedmanniomyces endolithicus]